VRIENPGFGKHMNFLLDQIYLYKKIRKDLRLCGFGIQLHSKLKSNSMLFAEDCLCIIMDLSN
jgi:hypothetical protein